MLVLTRKPYESIVIGDDVEVFVCGVVRDRVKLGINAPTSVRIVRAELLARDDVNCDHQGRSKVEECSEDCSDRTLCDDPACEGQES